MALTPIVASSSTGMLHRASVSGTPRRQVASAECSSDFRVGARAVYLSRPHEITEEELATAKLCRKCFPPAK